jgi:hypothetical protein
MMSFVQQERAPVAAVVYTLADTRSGRASSVDAQVGAIRSLV